MALSNEYRPLGGCLYGPSVITTGYPGFGNGIRHRYGLFKQRIVDGYQVEIPDAWFGSSSTSGDPGDHDIVDAKIFGNVSSMLSKRV